MAVERLEMPEVVGDEALSGFHDDGGREADLQTAMMGTAHQSGGRHDLETRGFSTAAVGDEAQAFLEHNRAQDSLLRGESHMDEAVYRQSPSEGGVEHWKRLYGNSENEKGELRRQLQAQAELAAQLQTHFTPPIQPPAFFAPQTPAPQTFAPAPVPAQPWGQSASPQSDAYLNEIMSRPDDEMVYAKDIKSMLRDTVAPLVGGVYGMAQAADARAMAAQSALFTAQKAQMGITPQVEQAVIAKNPWLAQLTDPSVYLNAVASFAAAAPRPVAPAPSMGPGNVMGDVAARRRTFVESAPGMGGREPSSRSGEVSWEQRWAETLKLPYGSMQRRQAQQGLLGERVGPQVSGFRDPNVLTR